MAINTNFKGGYVSDVSCGKKECFVLVCIYIFCIYIVIYSYKNKVPVEMEVTSNYQNGEQTALFQ